MPSAIFFDMIDELPSGGLFTVAVVSRNAYSLRSAGTRFGPGAQMTPPTVPRTSRISAFDRFARHPLIASSLSSVPPVWPRPRPDSCGTAAPHDATSGTRTSETLSPTPPVECLSTIGRVRLLRSRRSPESIIAAVQVTSSHSSMPRMKIAMSNADACSSATSPATYACMNHSICSSVSAWPSRLAAMTSTARTSSPRGAGGSRASAATRASCSALTSGSFSCAGRLKGRNSRSVTTSGSHSICSS